jgi:hypothetical protein
MRQESYVMRDPTAELSAPMRERVAPPAELAKATIGLLSISKERSSEFLDTIAVRLESRGLSVRRFEKPTHTKPAPEALVQDIVEACDVVVIGLAD